MPNQEPRPTTKNSETDDDNKQMKVKLPRNRLRGVIISKKLESMTYADVMKNLSEKVDIQKMGVTITSSRQTATRVLLLKVGKGPSATIAVTKLKCAVESAIREHIVAVRDSARPTMVLVLDICWANDSSELLSRYTS